MCDFSLQHAKSRSAVQADKLISHNFGRGTNGFKPADEDVVGLENATAVCILPGTELAFEKPIKLRWSYDSDNCIDEKFTTAIFRQVNKDQLTTHHDCLEFPNGEQRLLTYLEAGQLCTVLQLPAAPKTAEEVEEQRRAQYVG